MQGGIRQGPHGNSCETWKFFFSIAVHVAQLMPTSLCADPRRLLHRSTDRHINCICRPQRIHSRLRPCDARLLQAILASSWSDCISTFFDAGFPSWGRLLTTSRFRGPKLLIRSNSCGRSAHSANHYRGSTRKVINR